MPNNIKLKDYIYFTNAIVTGFGWIDNEDVARQWEGLIGFVLNKEQLAFLIKVLKKNNLLGKEE